MKKMHDRQINYCFADTEVDPHDITCVHEAFKAMHPEELLDVLLENQLGWKLDPQALTGSAKRFLLAKTQAILDMIYAIDPDPDQCLDEVLIPLQSFEYSGHGMSFTRTVRSVILDVSKASSEPSERMEYALSINDMLQRMKDHPHEEGELWGCGALRRIDELIMRPWSEILGHPIWIPSSLTSYEACAELAGLFWVMAYNGFAEAIFDIRASSLPEVPSSEEAKMRIDGMYEEHRLKMFRISEMLNCNSVADAMRAARALKRIA
ncbi:MAG: hypothetical protein HFJ65_06185 [Eggerthellaceae bacterium]|nr:hypothetical protein [Eggerthellaceae bacterium]